MTARSMMLPIVLMAAALLVFGCGGDDDGGNGAAASNGANSGSNSIPGASGASNDEARGDSDVEAPEITTSSITKAQFVKQADAICRAERKGIINELAAYVGEHQGKESEPKLNAGMIKEILLPTIEAGISKARELGAPAGDEAELEEILTEQERIIDDVSELNSVRSLSDYEARFLVVDKKIRAYGFEDCTNGPDPSITG